MLNNTANQSVQDDVRQKIEEKVKAAGMRERFISDDIEEKLVNEAVDYGLGADFADNVVASIAMEKGFVVESQLEHVLQVVLKHIGARTKGKVDKLEFEEAIAMAKDLTHDVVPMPRLQKKCKQIMIDNGIAPQSGGMFHADWFKNIG
jgi:hypothetical protein